MFLALIRSWRGRKRGGGGEGRGGEGKELWVEVVRRTRVYISIDPPLLLRRDRGAWAREGPSPVIRVYESSITLLTLTITDALCTCRSP